MVVAALWALLHMLAVVLARFGATEQANVLVIAGMAIGALANLVSALLAVMAGRVELITWLRWIILCCALVVISKPRASAQLHRWGLLMGLALFSAVVLDRTVVNTLPSSLAQSGELYLALCLMLAAALAEAQNAWTLRRARELLRQDAARYDLAWREVLETEEGEHESAQTLDEIAHTCQSLNPLPTSHHAPIQRRGLRATGGERWDAGGGAKGLMPVESLDQLACQAALAQPLLRERVQAWAQASRGWVRAREEKGGAGIEEAREEESEGAREEGATRERDGSSNQQFVLWEDVAAGRRSEAEVEWTRGKMFARAMHKAVKVYACEVWRLCDMARESLWFDSLPDLLACLQMLQRDPSVLVESVKNALTLPTASVAAHTGGFRFVKVLLRLRSDEAAELGLQGHVCELLLRLKSLELIQDHAMHQRYLDFRGARRADESLLSPIFRPFAFLSWLRRPQARDARGISTEDLESGRFRHSLVSAQPSQRSSFGLGVSASSEDGLESSVARGELPEEEEQERVERACRRVMVRYLAEANVGVLGEISQRMKKITEAVSRASSGSVFRMQRPMAAVLSKRKWQGLLMVCGVLVLCIGLIHYAAIIQSSSASSFRFSNLETRAGSDAPASPGIQDLALLHSGCQIRVPSAIRTVGAQLFLDFDQPVEYNEFQFTTPANGSSADDAVRFVLEQREEDTGAWKPVGSSSEFRIARWKPVLEHGRADIPTERGAQVTVRMHLGVAGQLGGAGGLGVGVTIIVAAGFGFCRRELLGVRVVKGMLMLAQIPPVAAAVLLVLGGREREGFCVAAWAAGGIVWVILVCVNERMFLEAFFCTGVILIVTTSVVQAVLVEPDNWIDMIDPFGVVYLGFYVLCRTNSWYNDVRVEHTYKQDCRMYEEVWKQVLEEDAQTRALDRLLSLTTQLSKGLPEQLLQACVPWHPAMDDDEEAVDPLWLARCSLTYSKLLLPLCPPPQSLDQLYAQAHVTAVILKYKLVTWSRACGGRCLVIKEGGGEHEGGVEFVRLADLEVGQAQHVRWGKVKTPLRALEKAHRCYGGNYSRLCDLARHSLVFETPEDLMECLEQMRADEDVQLLRVKNSLHADADAASSSGYRQVMLNLQIVTEWTERIGVATHVSEVQLLLKGFANAKTSEGHRRYVEARNGRGE